MLEEAPQGRGAEVMKRMVVTFQFTEPAVPRGMRGRPATRGRSENVWWTSWFDSEQDSATDMLRRPYPHEV